MKGKWAKGIAPRFFAWIIKDKLAVSERPGGYARNHRRVRRQEEILWLRGEGFTRVVSLLTSPHNLHAYDELDMAWAHIPFGVHDDPHVVLPELYARLREWMASGERLLVHHEELSDRLMGVVAGYLRWSGMVPDGPQAITVVERIMHRQMGPEGRELVALAPQLARCAAAGPRRSVTSEDGPRPRETPDTPGPAERAAPPPAESTWPDPIAPTVRNDEAAATSPGQGQPESLPAPISNEASAPTELQPVGPPPADKGEPVHIAVHADEANDDVRHRESTSAATGSGDGDERS